MTDKERSVSPKQEGDAKEASSFDYEAKINELSTKLDNLNKYVVSTLEGVKKSTPPRESIHELLLKKGAKNG